MLLAGYAKEFLGYETPDIHSIGMAELHLWTDSVKRVSKESLADPYRPVATCQEDHDRSGRPAIT